jgi:hypothetical protein
MLPSPPPGAELGGPICGTPRAKRGAHQVAGRSHFYQRDVMPRTGRTVAPGGGPL